MIIKLIFFVILNFLFAGISIASILNPTAKVTLKVVDTKGNPLEGAKATVRFYIPTGAGMGWGVNTKFIEGLTDKNGLFTAEGETTEDCGMTVRKDGFYLSSGKCNLEKISTINRWEPWNLKVKVVLKEKRNPVAMYAKRTDFIKVPALDNPVGYDLEKGDWVAPHGKGLLNDFIFNFKTKFVSRDEWECSYKLTFSNEMDGIQVFTGDKNDQSEYRFPYEAPDSGYKSELQLSNSYNSKGKHVSGFDSNKRYIFRIRTKTDQKGNIIGANYGKIIGDIVLSEDGFVKFEYYFNPNGSKNLEYDATKALFKWKTIKELNHKVDGP